MTYDQTSLARMREAHERARQRSASLPFEERPTEIPPDSPHALDAMARAARLLAETGDSVTAPNDPDTRTP